MDKIIAVVVTYNRKELLYECIKSLKAQVVKTDILIIDNGSSDGTYDMLEKYINNKEIIYVNTGTNLGGAGGFNFGIREACKKKYDYIWIMDDDTIPSKTALKELINANQILGESWGCLSSMVLYGDSETELAKMNIQRIDDKWSVNGSYLEKGIIKIQDSTFVSCLIKYKVVEEIGLPISDFFIWNDDREYTHRISKKYNCYLISRSIVHHKINNNIECRIESDSNDRMWRYKYVYRNGMYIAKNKGIEEIVKFHVGILRNIKKILESNCNSKFKRILIMLKSLFAGYIFCPKIEFINKKDLLK